MAVAPSILTAQVIEDHLREVKERRLAAGREYKKRNRERVLAQQRAYKSLHREEMRTYWQEWYSKNRDRVLARKRQRDPAVMAAEARAYRETHRDEVNRRQRERNRMFPERMAQFVNRYRARRSRAPGTFTVEEWLDVIKVQKGRCFWCREVRPLTRDHLIPLSKGGPDCVSNIVAACRSCNSKKHDLDGLEYLARIMPHCVVLNGY